MAGFLIPFAISTGLKLITSLFTSTPTQKAQEPNLTVPTSNYGTPIPYIYGKIRLSGTLFFPNKKDILYRVETTTTRTGGGKGGGGGQKVEEKKVYGTFAIQYCIGKTIFKELLVNGVGHSINSEFFTNYCTFFDGTQTSPWSVVQNKEDDPYKDIVHKDISYIGFEDVPLADYGNTVPQQLDAILESVDFPERPDLGEVVKDICLKAGIDEDLIDVTEITGKDLELGLLVPQGGESYRDVLSELMQYYLFTAVETKEGKIAFKTFDRTGKTNENPIVIDPLQFFPISDNGFENKLFIKKNLRQDDKALPNKVVCSFLNENRRYNRDELTEYVEDGDVENVLTLKLNIATYPYLVKWQLQLLIRYLFLQKKNTYTFELPSSWINQLDLLDLIQLPNSEVVQIYQITMGTDYSLKITASYYKGSLDYNYVPPNPEDLGNKPIFQLPAIPNIYILDIPNIEDYPPGTLYVLSELACTIAVSFDGQQSYDTRINHVSPSTIGTVLTSLPNVIGLDTVNTIDIELESGAIESISQAQFDIVGRYNLALIGNITPEGSYLGKFIQFRDILPLGNNQYRLSYLYQGWLNTDDYDTSNLPLKFFLLRAPTTGYYSVLEGDSRFLNIPIDIIPITSPLQNLATTLVTTITPKGNSYKPPAPTNATGIIDIDDNIEIYWDYTALQSSYNNAQENITFEIDIYQNTSSTTVVRTLTSVSKKVQYLTSDRTTDSVSVPLKVAIYAISSVVGRGYPLIAEINPILINDSIFGTGGETGLKGITLIYDNYTVQESDNRKVILGIATSSFAEYIVTFPLTLSNGFECYVVNSLEGNGLGNRNSFFTIQGVTFLTRTHNNRIKAGESRLFVHVSEGKYFTLGKNDIIYDYQSITSSGTAFVNILWAIDSTGISLNLPPNPVEGAFIGFKTNPALDFRADPVTLNGNGKLIEGVSTYIFNRTDERIILFFTGEQWYYLTRFYDVDVQQEISEFLENFLEEIIVEGDNIYFDNGISPNGYPQITINTDSDMKKSIYDTNDNGTVDIAELALNSYLLNGVDSNYHLSRTNHTGTQLSTTISDFNEAVEDKVSSLLVAIDNIELTYLDSINTLEITLPTFTIYNHVNDLLSPGQNITLTYNNVNELTISVPNENIDDRVNNLLIAGDNTTLTYDDIANTLTISVPNENIDDRVNNLLIAGDNITLTYDDIANTLTIDATAGGNPNVMLKNVYDFNNNGVVDNSERLNGELPSYYLNYTNLSDKPFIPDSEFIQDTVSTLIVDTNSIVKTYNDVANTLSLETQTLPKTVSSNTTLLASDNKKWIKASGTITITVGTQVNYFECIIQNVGTGIITIAGVTNAVGTKLASQWRACHIYYDGVSWTAVGYLTT
jgi:hypothetical protein